MYAQILASFSNLFKGLFELKKTKIENQATTNIINDKQDYKKATNIAEKIIRITTKYKRLMTFSDRLKFTSLIKDFEKFN